MTDWPPKRETLGRPAYRGLVRAVESSIESGRLQPGQRLPTHRKLAHDLGLSVQTVSRAYERLIETGRVTGEVGRGTFVRNAGIDGRTPFISDGARGDLVDLSLLKPVIGEAHENALRDALRRVARDMPRHVMTSFRPAGMIERYRRPIARWLARCGLDVANRHIVPTNGSTAATHVALMTAAHAGDLVVTEAMGHHTLPPLCRYMGLRLRGLDLDGQGILPDAFEAACREGPVKLLYVMPSGLNPLGTVMSSERRTALVEIARAHDVAIVENDGWGPLLPDAPPAFATLAPERTLYFTGLTKCLLPGLRVGFLVVPEPLGRPAGDRHMVTNWMATTLMVEIAAGWIEDGTAARLLDEQRAALGRRGAFAARALRDTPHRLPAGGMHVWLPRKNAAEEDALIENARRLGVAVAPGASFSIGPRESRPHPGVRLSLGGVRFDDFANGLTTVARLAESRPDPALPSG